MARPSRSVYAKIGFPDGGQGAWLDVRQCAGFPCER